MGAVFLARDSRLGREVALKVMSGEFAANPERLERFRREARALAAIDHPNIVTVYSVEEEGGVHFLTMALVAGESLEATLASELKVTHLVTGSVRRVGDALRWIRIAIDCGYINHPCLTEHDPFLTDLRSDAEFQQLMAELKLRWEDVAEWERRVGWREARSPDSAA